MNRIPIYLCLISALLLLGAGEATPGQETTTGDVSNPFVGTWVLNLDKSSYLRPTNVKSAVLKIESQDSGLKMTSDRVHTDGNRIHLESSPKFDGKDYPVIGAVDRTKSLRRINKNSFEVVVKQYGEEIRSDVIVISEDGMTYTRTVKGIKNSDGQEVTLTFVYDKQ